MGKLDIFFLLLLLIPEASTFGPTIFGFRSLQRPHIRFRRHTHLAVNDEESGGSSGSEGNVGKSFGEVEAALVEEAEEKAKERTGMEQFREEERALFASKSEEISLIQQEISSRASNLGIKESSISQRIADKKDASDESIEVDIAQISLSTKKEKPKMPFQKEADETEDMAEEEMVIADPFYGDGLVKGMWNDLKLVEWPSIKQTITQAIIATVVLASVVYLILNLDASIKEFYQAIHLYPAD